MLIEEDDEAPTAPQDWRARLPETWPEHLDFLPVEGRGIGAVVLRSFEPGETVLVDKPYWTRPAPENKACRDIWTPEWTEAFDKIRAPLPGRGGRPSARLTASPAMLRNAVGYATSAPGVRRRLLQQWHPEPGSEHALVGIARKLAELCAERVDACRGFEVEELQRAILAIEMNVFMGGRMFALFSRVNHSCFPNVVYVATKDEFKMKALRPIAAGEELVHSYLGERALLPPGERRWQLWRSKCFRCICERCEEASDPLRSIPCRRCGRERRDLNARHWRVIHTPGVWLREEPSTSARQLGFFKVGHSFETTGMVSEDWVQVAGDKGGWVLTDGEPVGLGILCEPEVSYEGSWLAYHQIFKLSSAQISAGMNEEVPWKYFEALQLPVQCVADPVCGDVAYARFEGDHWHCDRCGHDEKDPRLLEMESVLSRLAERTFFSPEIVRSDGHFNVGGSNSKSRISMLREDFLAGALQLAEVVTLMLGHRHWTAMWARILFTDIAGSLREFSHVLRHQKAEPLRDMCLLWDWLGSLGLAQDPGCWLYERAGRFLSAASLPLESQEALDWLVRLRERHVAAQPSVNLLALRNYVLEGSVTFG